MIDRVVTRANAFISTFTVDPARRAEFEKMFDEMWHASHELMNNETNFVFYGWSRNENEFVAIESWKSEEVTNRLRGTPEFQATVGKLIELCSGPMTMQIFNGIDMPRTVFELYPKGPSKVHPSRPGKTTVFL